MKIILLTLISLCYVIAICVGAPARTSKDMIFFPTRANPIYNNFPPYFQTRGPFDFIGNWIQSSEWFPIEVNVPDTFASIGNGIGSFATNVGSGFNNLAQNVGSNLQTFSQNVGNGVQSFAQNLSQRFPVLGVFVRPNAPPRYFVLVPTKSFNNGIQNGIESSRNRESLSFNHINNDILELFP